MKKGILIEIGEEIVETKEVIEVETEIMKGIEVGKGITSIVLPEMTKLFKKKTLITKKDVRLRMSEEITLAKPKKWRLNWKSRSFSIKKKENWKKLKKSSEKHVHIPKPRKVNVRSQKRRSHNSSLLSSLEGKGKRYLEFLQ